jgi:hypothetical protein
MNIAQGTFLGATNISAVISDLWYDSEINFYPAFGVADLNVDGPGNDFNNWGHMSQVVWDSSISVGCGAVPCGSDTAISSGYFAVCIYYPPGKFDMGMLMAWTPWIG